MKRRRISIIAGIVACAALPFTVTSAEASWATALRAAVKAAAVGGDDAARAAAGAARVAAGSGDDVARIAAGTAASGGDDVFRAATLSSDDLVRGAVGSADNVTGAGARGSDDVARAGTRNADDAARTRVDPSVATVAVEGQSSTATEKLEWTMEKIEEAAGLYEDLSEMEHEEECPDVHLRLSLPQKRVPTTIDRQVVGRVGPGPDYKGVWKLGPVENMPIDVLTTEGCWIAIGRGGNTGWLPANALRFTFNDLMATPRHVKHLPRDDEAFVREVSRSSYRIVASRKDGGAWMQGLGVAVSPGVLLTSCTAFTRDTVEVYIEDDDGAPRPGLLERFDKYRCLVRSLELKLRPVGAVRRPEGIEAGEEVASVHTTLEHGATVSLGKVLKRGRGGVSASAPTDRASLGGGLYDRSGNLVAIVLGMKDDASVAMYADLFWSPSQRRG